MSSRQFSMVSPAIWRSRRFLALSTDKCRLLLLFYITCSHQNSAGCYRIPEGYACTDLGWPTDEYKSARQELVAADLVAYDDETEEVFVTGWFRVSPPTNKSHAQGTQKLISNIESDAIRSKVETDFAEAYAVAKFNRDGDRSGYSGFSGTRS